MNKTNMLFFIFLGLFLADFSFWVAPIHSSSTLTPSSKPTEDIWKILLSVKYKTEKQYYIPQFDPKIKAFDNQVVILKGYMYPLEEKTNHDFFMLSYYPINVCFFCGGAGPESVIEVKAKTPIKYTDKPLKIKGKLRLNATNKERLFYFLLNAEVVNE
jgi:hypothetical protein